MIGGGDLPSIGRWPRFLATGPAPQSGRPVSHVHTVLLACIPPHSTPLACVAKDFLWNPRIYMASRPNPRASSTQSHSNRSRGLSSVFCKGICILTNRWGSEYRYNALMLLVNVHYANLLVRVYTSMQYTQGLMAILRAPRLFILSSAPWKSSSLYTSVT